MPDPKDPNEPEGRDTPSDEMIDASLEPKTKGGLEVSPDANGYVLDDAGTVVGYIKVVSGSSLQFHWVSSAAAWPSKFDIRAPTAGLPSVALSQVFEHDAFPTGTTSLDLSTADYRIVQGGTVVGYLKVSGSALDWYAVPGELDANGYFPLGTLTFESFSGSGTVSAHHLQDQLL